MDDLAKKLASARDEVRVEWSAERRERTRRGIQRKQRHQTATRVGLTAALAVAAVVVVLQNTGALDPHSRPSPAVAVGTIEFEDGSRAVPLEAATRMRLVEQTPRRVSIELSHGRSRFVVEPNATRLFRVVVSAVEIRALGTVFTVAVLGELVHVEVARGRVLVTSPAGQAELRVGEQRAFPQTITPTADAEDEHAPEIPRHNRPRVPRRAVWRGLAQDGRYEEAYAEIEKLGPSAIPDKAVVLMEAADAARLSGHPERATKYLRRVMRRHPNDPLAPLAAFTLGRLLLDELGKPRQAADAFAHAREIDPNGSLAQDALARQVEAWSKAGDNQKAQRAAMEYLERYPNGRRLRAVKKLGNLE